MDSEQHIEREEMFRALLSIDQQYAALNGRTWILHERSHGEGHAQELVAWQMKRARIASVILNDGEVVTSSLRFMFELHCPASRAGLNL